MEDLEDGSPLEMCYVLGEALLLEILHMAHGRQLQTHQAVLGFRQVRFANVNYDCEGVNAF